MSNLINSGKRFICMLRQSDASEGAASVAAQLIYLVDEGKRRGMTYVDKVSLEGLTGSMPGKRHDLTALICRKKEKDDFDVLLIQRIDRLTRSGPKHGMWFEHECTCAGISVLFVGDDIPEGRYSSLIKVVKYEAAFEQAFSTSQRSSQGMQFALDQGRVITCTHTPYGCWRLYLTGDSIPSHMIRDLGDGRQEKLDPETFEVLDHYGSIGGGGIGHYRKQKNEKVLLHPGDRDKVDTVREIFRLHYCEGWGGKRISDVLNSRGTRSPRGKQWGQRQVESIYEQSAYTGRSIGNRVFSGIHHKRGRGRPQPLNRDPAELATAEYMRPTLRPFDEWEIQLQPLMKDFLDEQIKELARASQEKLWAWKTDKDRVRKSNNKHPASDYLLSNLLACKQDGEKLVGVQHGKKGKEVRSYRHKRSRREYRKGSIFNRMIPAEPLEKAVVEVLAEMLSNIPDLKKKVASFIADSARSTSESSESLDDLKRRRDKIKKRTELIVSSLDEDTLADVQGEIQQLRVERSALDKQIAVATATQKHQGTDPDETVERVMNRLTGMKEQLRTLPAFLVRQLLTQILVSAVVDMETKDVEIQLALPSWAVWDAPAASGAVCLEPSSESPASFETHPHLGIDLGSAKCQYLQISQRVCYQCRRIGIAA